MARPNSSKRRHREKPAGKHLRTCPAHKGKIRYPRRKVALTALNFLRSNQVSASTVPRDVYECPDCGDWHLTSRPPR